VNDLSDQAAGAGAAEKPEKKKKRPVEAAIRLDRVSKRFGATRAVNELTLRVPAGAVFGLIGPNGAGKTTTFSMLAGYLRPTEGTLEVLGHEPTQVDLLRSRLGVLPQDAVLPAGDRVGEFLVYAARLQDLPRAKAEEAARAILAEVDGRDWWDKRCGSLSHGMAKRVALAQALIGDPEVVLLDEPTAGLDPRVAYEVRQLVKARRKRCTLIISSHNLQELEEVCDAAAILDRGVLVAQGKISELTAASEEVRVKIGGALAGEVMARVREAAAVTQVDFDRERGELCVLFDRSKGDAEEVIAAVLWILLHEKVRISGVTKGRGLEQRVMELTD
jgi:ABC-type multidrug transport system ATPase subunit